MKKLFLGFLVTLCVASVQAQGLKLQSVKPIERAIGELNLFYAGASFVNKLGYERTKPQMKKKLGGQYPLVKQHCKDVVGLILESERFKDYAAKEAKEMIDGSKLISSENPFNFIIADEQYRMLLADVHEIIENNLNRHLCADEHLMCFFDAMLEHSVISSIAALIPGDVYVFYPA